jgi:hypothetical protein
MADAGQRKDRVAELDPELPGARPDRRRGQFLYPLYDRQALCPARS